MNSHENKIFSLRNILIILITAAIVTAMWWVLGGPKHFYTTRVRPVLSRQPSMPSQIEPWMTFNYINVVFRLPPSLLQQALAINDRRYPNVSLVSYAKAHNKSVSEIILQIQSTISNTGNKQ